MVGITRLGIGILFGLLRIGIGCVSVELVKLLELVELEQDLAMVSKSYLFIHEDGSVFLMSISMDGLGTAFSCSV